MRNWAGPRWHTGPMSAPTPLPLSGLIVADFSRVLAGPYAAMTLGDLGADVIKVERPGTGDDTRGMPPFWNGVSCYYVAANRNKRSITLDLGKPAARAVLRRLVRTADILIENFKTGTMEGWGLGALGSDGPGHVIDLMIDELQSALGQIGAMSPAEARNVKVRHPGALHF